MNPQRPLAAEVWTENCLKSVVSKNKRLLLGNEGLNQKSVRIFYAYIIVLKMGSFGIKLWEKKDFA